MQRVADFQRAGIGLDVLRNVVDRAFHVDGVGDDVDGAAALDTGGGFSVHDMQGNADADGRALAEPHDGALAELLFDLRQRGLERLGLFAAGDGNAGAFDECVHLKISLNINGLE